MRIELDTGGFAERPGTQNVAKALAISPDGRFYAIGRQGGPQIAAQESVRDLTQSERATFGISR